jgi:hypothetical protein
MAERRRRLAIPVSGGAGRRGSGSERYPAMMVTHFGAAGRRRFTMKCAPW